MVYKDPRPDSLYRMLATNAKMKLETRPDVERMQDDEVQVQPKNPLELNVSVCSDLKCEV